MTLIVAAVIVTERVNASVPSIDDGFSSRNHIPKIDSSSIPCNSYYIKP